MMEFILEVWNLALAELSMGSIKAILCGIASGIITAVMGYFKSKEQFELSKFLETVAVGAIVGAYMGYAGVTYEQAQDFLMSIGAITLIEYVIKSIYKRAREHD